MKKICDTSFLTPVKITVANAVSNPLGVISSSLLTLSWLLLSALDFTKGLLLLPAILLNIIADSVASYKAGCFKGNLGLKLSMFSNVFGFLLSAIFFVLLLLDLSFLRNVLGGALSNIGFALPFPLNNINTGYLNIELFLLPLALLFLSKLISAAYLLKSVRRNIPKLFAHWICAFLLLLSLAALVSDGLDRIQIIPSHYNYCGTQTDNHFIMYSSAAVGLLAAIAVLLQLVNTFITIHKMRKTKNAF